MKPVTLIADSGSTKGEWCLIKNGRKKTLYTQGISPYFLTKDQIVDLLQTELAPQLKADEVEAVYYYGTGCANPQNAGNIKKALKKVFGGADVEVHTDLMAAARALCGRNKGIASILGTGSNSAYYNGTKIVANSPGLGFILGDEGSGAYLGKKVIQYFLYNTFDSELRDKFNDQYQLTPPQILDNVYKKPLPNRFLAQFALFLADNRGHFMVENILEDGISDFFFQHLSKYPEAQKYPVHFVGSVAFGFKDVIKELCISYKMECGQIVKNPMEGLIAYHKGF